MSSLERHLVFLSVSLLPLACIVWAAGGGGFQMSVAQAATSISNAGTLTYYGADISTNRGLSVSTNVQTSNTRPNNGPWPQLTTNYCFLRQCRQLPTMSTGRKAQLSPSNIKTTRGRLTPIPATLRRGPMVLPGRFSTI